MHLGKQASATSTDNKHQQQASTTSINNMPLTFCATSGSVFLPPLHDVMDVVGAIYRQMRRAHHFVPVFPLLNRQALGTASGLGLLYRDLLFAQQVTNGFVVNLHHGHFHVVLVCLLSLVHHRKQFVQRSCVHTWIVRGSLHGVCFTGTCLAIGKDATVKPIHGLEKGEKSR